MTQPQDPEIPIDLPRLKFSELPEELKTQVTKDAVKRSTKQIEAMWKFTLRFVCIAAVLTVAGCTAGVIGWGTGLW